MKCIRSKTSENVVDDPQKAISYKAEAILLKTRNGFYADIEGLPLLAIIYLYLENRKEPFPCGFFMEAKAEGTNYGELFVDEQSIKPYHNSQERGPRISLKKLAKQQK
jgi:hypothetical protein